VAGLCRRAYLNQVLLDSVWVTFRGLPWVVQGIVWILVLPVTAGLWIWETPWPLWLRLLLVIGLAWVTIFTFWPRK
jgi:hypothetical protein